MYVCICTGTTGTIDLVGVYMCVNIALSIKISRSRSRSWRGQFDSIVYKWVCMWLSEWCPDLIFTKSCL